MKIKTALSTFGHDKKEKKYHLLLTPWGEALDGDKVLREYPRPQMVRDSYLNLNGYWEYAITELPKSDWQKVLDPLVRLKTHKSEEPSVYDGLILVPFSPETILSGVRRKLLPNQLLWYRRVFDINEFPDGKRLLLHFGAVDQICRVFINGNEVTKHVGGYLAFSVDITSSLHTGSNTLTVCVRDISDTSWLGRGKQKLNPGGMFYTAQSGIWQTVWMEWVPDLYIERLKITPLFDEQAVEVTVFTSKETQVSVAAGKSGSFGRATGVSGQPLLIHLKGCPAWTPESPTLVPLIIKTKQDHVNSYFAMRKYSVMRDEQGIMRLALNNHPYFQNGVLDQGYWSDGLYTAPSDEAMIYDIRTMKDLGFNMIRKHIKIEPMRWYYHCDRLGMIVWQDIINGGGRSLMTFLLYLPTTLPLVISRFSDHNYPLFSRASKRGRTYWLSACRKTMEQLYNCPCIGLWTAFNEGWGQFDSLSCVRHMKTWDQTRLIDHASGWYDQGGGDIASYHNYFRNLTVKPEARPYCFTEYGGYSYHVKGHCFCTKDFAYTKYPNLTTLQKAFFALQKEIKELQKQGLAAAVYTQVSDVEEEINGIMTFDRRINKLDEQTPPDQ